MNTTATLNTLQVSTWRTTRVTRRTRGRVRRRWNVTDGRPGRRANGTAAPPAGSSGTSSGATPGGAATFWATSSPDGSGGSGTTGIDGTSTTGGSRTRVTTGVDAGVAFTARAAAGATGDVSERVDGASPGLSGATRPGSPAGSRASAAGAASRSGATAGDDRERKRPSGRPRPAGRSSTSVAARGCAAPLGLLGAEVVVDVVATGAGVVAARSCGVEAAAGAFAAYVPCSTGGASWPSPVPIDAERASTGSVDAPASGSPTMGAGAPARGRRPPRPLRPLPPAGGAPAALPVGADLPAPVLVPFPLPFASARVAGTSGGRRDRRRRRLLLGALVDGSAGAWLGPRTRRAALAGRGRAVVHSGKCREHDGDDPGRSVSPACSGPIGRSRSSLLATRPRPPRPPRRRPRGS